MVVGGGRDEGGGGAGRCRDAGILLIIIMMDGPGADLLVARRQRQRESLNLAAALACTEACFEIIVYIYSYGSEGVCCSAVCTRHSLLEGWAAVRQHALHALCRL